MVSVATIGFNMNLPTTSEAPWAQFAGPLAANAVARPEAAQPHNGSSTECERWRAVVGSRLAEWQENPAVLEDEAVEAPRLEIIQWAAQVAMDLRAAGLPAPQRVAATGDGGIVFVRQEGPVCSTIEVASDRSVELVVVEDSRLVSRRRLR